MQTFLCTTTISSVQSDLSPVRQFAQATTTKGTEQKRTNEQQVLIGYEGAKSFVEQELSKHPVVMFALSNCQACTTVKEILGKYKLGKQTCAVHDIDQSKN